jgi:CheY-like chemotaxis protein
VTGLDTPDEVIEHCYKDLPDLILVSLSLPGEGAFSLFNSLKSSAQTKSLPIFGLCVKIDTEGQTRALQQGFSAVITKPIVPDEMKGKILRALKLDDSGEFFKQEKGALVVHFPREFTPNTATKISAHLRAQVTEAVDCGLDKVILDLRDLQKADFEVIKTGLDVIELCKEVTLAHRVVASDSICNDCNSIEEAKGWQFSASLDDALAALEAPESVAV